MTRDCLIVQVAFDILEEIQLLTFGKQSSGQPDHSICSVTFSSVYYLNRVEERSAIACVNKTTPTSACEGRGDRIERLVEMTVVVCKCSD